MRRITVEPEQLELVAGRMEEENDMYIRQFQQLFNLIDVMSASWEGSDRTAFTTQVSAYQDDCRQLSFLCSLYIDFLRSSAMAYRDIQDELTSEAMRLVN